MPATWVEFPAFRRYEATRQQANNALMAMLAGSQLAAHTLQLTQGSTQLLPDIFPGVAEIQYFRLRTDAATELLSDVGPHLGSVAVPYVLAVHEDFVMSVLRMLSELGHAIEAPGTSKNPAKNPVKAWNMHEAVHQTLGVTIPAGVRTDQLAIFHLMREMRNCQIHAGGKLSTALHDRIAAMSPTAGAAWKRWSHRLPSDVLSQGRVEFTKFDIFAVLANAKILGRELNRLLANELPKSTWARIAVADYSEASSKPARSDAWGRGLVGHARLLYAAAGLTDADVLSAATTAGMWDDGRILVPRRRDRAARTQRDPGSMAGGPL